MRKDLLAGKKARRDVVLGNTSTISVKVNVEWQPAQHDVDMHAFTNCRVASLLGRIPELHVHHTKDKTVPYEEVNGAQLFRSERLPQFNRLAEEVHDTDSLGPRSLSSFGAPPVTRVKAVYGTNLPTEVSAVYRHRGISQKEGVDKPARIKSDDHVIKDGIIMETEKTPHDVRTNEIAHLSGDGTVRISFNQRNWLMIQSYECACPLTHLQVPYYSLQHRRMPVHER
mmetsp:Transcript_2867/g.5292  ORF Transcript_2867/g.5292 Transcript_2867/m.5292 type:complete len:227 (-) Transcript_2867:957-1637(-)